MAMLADRPRLRWGIAIAVLLALVSSALVLTTRSPVDARDDARSVHAIERRVPVRCDRVGPRQSPDTLHVVLRERAEWTGIPMESDWAKSYRMAWTGPIQTWTTMQKVHVPALDHRMLESVEPLASEQWPVHRLLVRVRVVVPGDLEAALEWVRSRPEVERASIALDVGRANAAGDEAAVGYD